MMGHVRGCFTVAAVLACYAFPIVKIAEITRNTKSRAEIIEDFKMKAAEYKRQAPARIQCPKNDEEK